MKRLSILFALTAILAAGNAHAQEWQMLSSFPGRPASTLRVTDTQGAQGRDFDGDGVADRPFISGTGSDMTIISGADPGQRWQIPLPNGIIAILIAFIDFDGKAGSNGAVKEILLAQKVGRRYVNPVVLYNIDATQGTYDVRVPDQGSVLIGGWDVDNDGTSELIIADPIKKEVQVWGLR